MVTKKKIEWQGGILDSNTDTPIVIKTSKSQLASREHSQSNSNTFLSNTNYNTEPKKIMGRCSLRLEKKGRGGSPAIILFKFSDPEAKNTASLKQLCSNLKTKLACGGTLEEGEILLTLQDIEKVKKILLTFSIKPEI